MTVQTEARYADLTRLPGPTGGSIQRQMATLRARLIARYNLTEVPGKPEELVGNLPSEAWSTQQGKYPTRTISLGYGCGTIRIRKHGIGAQRRRWIDRIDLQVNDGWHAQVYAFLDGFMEYKPGEARAKTALTQTAR